MPRLTIVIPFLAADELLEDTLASVLQNRPFDCEVVVVHRGSYEDPYELGDEVSFVEVAQNLAIADCLNAGIWAAQGDVIHILACGYEVDEDWTELAIDHFDDPRVAMVAPLVVDKNETNRTIAAGVRMSLDGSRSICCAGKKQLRRQSIHARPTGPSRMAGFYRRDIVIASGGFDQAISADVIDLDLALSIRTLGFVCNFEPGCVVRGQAPTLSSDSALAHGRNAQRMAWRHASVNGWPLTIFAHPFAVAIGCVIGCLKPSIWLQTLGRATACFEVGKFTQHRRRLIAARQSFAPRIANQSNHEPGTEFDESPASELKRTA